MKTLKGNIGIILVHDFGYTRYLLIFLTVLICRQYISANELIFRTYEPDYHIEGKKITSVTEDPRGFLLLGTLGGIYLFDGLQYTSIIFPDSLKKHEVTNLMCEGKSLWAGLSNGYVIYYEQTGSEPGLLISCNSAVTDIQIDKNRNLWVATYGDGLFVYDKFGKSRNYTQKDGLSDGFIYALEVDSSAWVWVGTDAGLVRCMMKDEKVEIQACTHKDLFPDLIVQALAFDQNNVLWIGFNEGGVVCYDISNEKILCNISAEAIRNGVVSSLLTIDDDVWIATRDGNLFCYNQVSKFLTEFSGTNINPLPSRMLKLCISHLGGFWVVGDDKVTWSFGREIEIFYEENGHNVGETHALLADSKDNLWYCNDKGLFRKSLKGDSKLPSDLVFTANEFNKVFFTCLYEDSSGFIWIGTFDRGIIVLNPESGKYQTYDEKNGLSNNNVLSIAGQNNQIWLSTFAGVSRATKYADGSIRFERLNQKSGLGNNYIYQIFIASDSRVWFATDGSGLSYYENGRFVQLNDSRIIHKAVYSITQDHRGALWFAIADEGVFRLQGDSLRQFGLADGLGSLSVTSVAVADSFIVVVNNHRIDLIDTQSGVVIQTGENIELHNIKAGLNAITSDSSGRFWIGTQFGYIALKNPVNIANLKPILNLKRVLVNLRPIRFDQPIELAYDQNYLSFDFTGIWYPRPGDMRFKVKLDGQDLDWYYTRDLFVSYSNLAPGSYTFHLLVAGNSDIVSEKQIILSFIIRSPFWQRWWFIAICLGIILLLLRWYLHVRLKKIKKEQQILHEKIEYEYSNLRNQVNPHFLFNSFSTLIALIESDSKKAVSYVEKLSDYFRSILQYRDTELITIIEEQLLLENYIFLQQKRYANGLHLSINIPEEVQNNQIPPMTLQMLAENALKHNIASRSKQLVIEVFLEGDYLVVSNNLQPKNNPEVSTALGLKNISERYRLFADKQIIVEKSQDKFIVKLPVIHRQLKKL